MLGEKEIKIKLNSRLIKSHIPHGPNSMHPNLYASDDSQTQLTGH